MSHARRRLLGSVLWPLGASLLVLTFYLLTLAPTVLWGDDAYFQRIALTGELSPDGGGHWLWLQLARLFVRLPWGDVAFRSNLLSAVAATGTVGVLYSAARQIELKQSAATVTLVTIAVAHTFWMHAVRAEVYTVFTFFIAIHFWLWARWAMPTGREGAGSLAGDWPLYLGAALFGITLLAHQMAIFVLPGWILLMWQQRRHLAARTIFSTFAALLLGMLPFLLVINVQIASVAGVSIPAAVRLYFTHSGADFSPSLLDVSVATLPRDLTLGILLTALQFCSPALALILIGSYERFRVHWRAPWLSLLAFYVANLIFAVTYRVNDFYVFFLPGYLVLALFAGAGWQVVQNELLARRSRFAIKNLPHLILASCFVLLLAMPLTVYYVAPRLVSALEVNPLQIRALPGRDPNEFFLWPGKRGYLGALDYGQSTLLSLPQNAVLIADHTPIQTLIYLQEVVGLRKDVRLVAIEPGVDLAPLLNALPADVPIYLADSNPEYYNLRSVPDASLAASGPVFRLELPAN